MLDILQDEKKNKYSGGIYHKTQIDLTYNSNHMEGSRLTLRCIDDWFAIGDYKKLPNEVGGMETALPEEVPGRMETLLAGYNSREEKNFNQILRSKFNLDNLILGL